MQQNVGSIDRMMRAVIGPTLVTYGVVDAVRHGLGFGNAAAMLGGVFVTTSAITRVCQVNAMLGIDTRSEADRRLDGQRFRAGTFEPTDKIDTRMRSDRDAPSRLFPQMEEHWARTHQPKQGVLHS